MPAHFHRIGLIAKTSPVVCDTLRELIRFLGTAGHEVILEQGAAQLLGQDGVPGPELVVRSDLVITVGGDGTLLAAARLLAEREIPLLGINLGRLGFLADLSPQGLALRLEAILGGAFDEEHRFLLRTEILRDQQVSECHLAFNDAVIHKWNTGRLIEFESYVNGHFVDFQRSDGLIVSTPTGSTAYALSGGGPLMEPRLEAIVMVPICPHKLSNRPIVVGSGSIIDIIVCGTTDPANVRVSCDGQTGFAIQQGDTVRIRRHPGAIRLIHPQGHDHFDIMRAKLGWGEHPTN
jgi:NAD+ kinase